MGLWDDPEEDEEAEELARNTKDWWLFVHDSSQNWSVLEEAGFNMIYW
jgi:hypothetical protein